jgi:hypothetical protein
MLYVTKKCINNLRALFLKTIFAGTYAQFLSGSRNMQCTSTCTTFDKFTGSRQLLASVLSDMYQLRKGTV